MKPTTKTSKAIRAIFRAASMIAVSGWRFAQGASIPDSLTDLSGTITVKNANSNAFAEISASDEPGHYLGSISYLGNYTRLASRPNYNPMSALDVVDLSDDARKRLPEIAYSEMCYGGA